MPEGSERTETEDGEGLEMTGFESGRFSMISSRYEAIWNALPSEYVENHSIDGSAVAAAIARRSSSSSSLDDSTIPIFSEYGLIGKIAQRGKRAISKIRRTLFMCMKIHQGDEN